MFLNEDKLIIEAAALYQIIFIPQTVIWWCTDLIEWEAPFLHFMLYHHWLLFEKNRSLSL